MKLGLDEWDILPHLPSVGSVTRLMRRNEMTEQERIYSQAARAAKAGKSILDCPYRNGTKRFVWRQAYRESRQILDWAKETAGYEPR